MRFAGFTLAALAALAGLVAMAAVRDADWSSATEIPAPSHCRRMCSTFARLSCWSVEEDCGRNGKVVVIAGLPYNCADVERVACALYHGDEDCLAECEDGGTQ